MNQDIKLLSDNADPFPVHNMARKIIPRNLKPLASLKYLSRGGPKLFAKVKSSILYANSWKSCTPNKKLNEGGSRKATTMTATTATAVHNQIRRSMRQCHAESMPGSTSGRTAPTSGTTRTMTPTVKKTLPPAAKGVNLLKAKS